MKNLLSLIALLAGTAFQFLHAQGTNLPLNDFDYHLLDRYEIGQKSFANYHTSFKPIRRLPVATFFEQKYDSLQRRGTDADVFNSQFVLNDNWEWTDREKIERKPILGVFYKNIVDLYSVETRDFNLHVKPVLWLQAGFENNDEPAPWRNTRGLELRFNIEDKVSFYSFIAENQARFPGYVRGRINDRLVVPGEAFWKDFKEDGVDYFTARGHVSFNPIKSINLQLGHERFSIGNGLRSMILSDYGPAFPYFKIQTKVWRFSYTNLFAQTRGDIPASPTGSRGSVSYPKKFFALHHLSLNITDNLNVGIFEAIVSGDSLSNGIEADYFNPIIFYRAVEQYGGSQDNALVGLDGKWNVAGKLQFYGQFVLDEFLLEAYRQGNGWWGNKWSSQLGAKYVNIFGLPNVDLQLEWNRARPFMYSHQNGYTNYTHYGQPLAHPLGANFNELMGRMNWQPFPRLWLQGTLLSATYGTDPEGQNFGGDIFKSYNSRTQDEGNEIGQGLENKLLYAEGYASYMLAHRLWLEGTLGLRTNTVEGSEEQNSLFALLGIRWNIGRTNNLYF